MNIYEGAALIATGPANPAFNIALPLPTPPGPLKATHTLAAYAVDRFPVGGSAGPSVNIFQNQTATCLPPVPVTTLSATSPVAYNGTAVVTWNAPKASTCTGIGGSAGWAGAHPNTGSFMTPPLLSNMTFSMYCTNDGGNGPTVSTTVIIGAPSVPVISGVTQPDYCTSGPEATVSWSSVVQPQTAYQLQLSTDPAFAAPGAVKYDSGKMNQYVAQAHAPWYIRMLRAISSLFTAHASTSSSASVPLGIMQYATTYYARVRVWDNAGNPTGWSASSNPIKVPTGAYPTVAVSVTPAKPLSQLPATFSDDTAYKGDAILIRTWDFGDGTVVSENAPLTSTIDHTYTNTAAGLTAKMTVTTAAMLPGQSCSVTLPINVGQAIPKFEEVRP